LSSSQKAFHSSWTKCIKRTRGSGTEPQLLLLIAGVCVWGYEATVCLTVKCQRLKGSELNGLGRGWVEASGKNRCLLSWSRFPCYDWINDFYLHYDSGLKQYCCNVFNSILGIHSIVQSVNCYLWWWHDPPKYILNRSIVLLVIHKHYHNFYYHNYIRHWIELSVYSSSHPAPHQRNLYTSIISPLWTLNRILRMITEAPLYVRNDPLNADLQLPLHLDIDTTSSTLFDSNQLILNIPNHLPPSLGGKRPKSKHYTYLNFIFYYLNCYWATTYPSVPYMCRYEVLHYIWYCIITQLLSLKIIKINNHVKYIISNTYINRENNSPNHETTHTTLTVSPQLLKMASRRNPSRSLLNEQESTERHLGIYINPYILYKYVFD
jgi:hypothetical protein